MEKISIFNYEAYYLDYLEGNLDEEDASLLLAFLEANPDLRLEDEHIDMIVEPESSVLDNKSKLDLLQPGEEDVISLDNIEYFMIAAQEGILNKSKQAEVLAFLDAHPSIQRDWKIYQHTSLKPNLSTVYLDKEELKQKTRILWPYVSIAAAASVAALIMFWPVGSQEAGDNLGFLAGNVRTETHTSTLFKKVNSDELGFNQNFSDDVENENIAIDLAYENKHGAIQFEDHKKPVNQLNYRPAGSVSSIFGNLELQPIARTTFELEENSHTNAVEYAINDMASARYIEMKNPIEPLTKFVSEKTNTDIDFRKTEKNADGNKGFYLKLGKFEFSRKKH